MKEPQNLDIVLKLKMPDYSFNRTAKCVCGARERALFAHSVFSSVNINDASALPPEQTRGQFKICIKASLRFVYRCCKLRSDYIYRRIYQETQQGNKLFI